MEELRKLVNSLNEVKTYKKEAVLIDIYIYILKHKESLLKNSLLDVFVEISNWRDVILCDGSQGYYEDEIYEEKKSFIENLKKHASTELLNMYEAGFQGGEENWEIIDDWVVDNKWQVNDWLSAMIRTYMN